MAVWQHKLAAKTALDGPLGPRYSPPRLSIHWLATQAVKQVACPARPHYPPPGAANRWHVAFFPLARPGAAAVADRQRAGDHRSAASGDSRRFAGDKHHA